MKITVEIPEWAQERDIYILAGFELLAAKKAGSKKLLVKKVRCNGCGNCCKVFTKDGSFRFPTKDNHCAHLQIYADGKTECGNPQGTRPAACIVGDPVLDNWSDKEGCVIEYGERPIRK
jgi:hypothetical protein